ncbi:bifunctional folylpolyglutamate synthase/dihydrofolate synthase [Novosphingobium decolorationis]|uniref:Bifunctional folylpolyglutamate synthase/dihydrofolate synthase n=1 Tax=Novosphingobium decolorationis TaxID=2698673 RepID=A0ABX8EDN8_9SPHN|nr:folylpolyglutamate synthase/dihydrofolate synthase family protein [Novosphingobium decolorationis]QVM85881.1 bifunctional folylpolyglutamate synthase/dihydrofolate synthase [Novosphingobium decolorationis]
MSRPNDFAVSEAPAVQTQLDRLAALSVPQGRLGLDVIKDLCAHLGHPERALPPVFHVAGTNGKGSTCAFLRAALEAAGKTVHVFTSPHLVRFNERIRVAGTLISDELLAELLAEVFDVAETHGIGASFFEISTAAAFLAFSRIPADACIFEVGLGGRLDATNVIPDPLVCGIAALGIDHEQFLLSPSEGTPDDPFARIAFEKAGIAKAGAALVTLSYGPGMNETVEAQAERAGTYVVRAGSDWSTAPEPDGFSYQDHKGLLHLPRPRLSGPHQTINAGLAVAMLRHQDAIAIPDAALAAAMDWARWPARLQRLEAGPLTALLPEGTPCWLDGGHNPDAGNALAQHFREPRPYVHLVIGMLANKDPYALIRPLAAQLASVTVVPVPGHEWHGAEDFDYALSPEATSAAGVRAALEGLDVKEGEVVLIGGSLYLAGTVLAANHQLPD